MSSSRLSTLFVNASRPLEARASVVKAAWQSVHNTLGSWTTFHSQDQLLALTFITHTPDKSDRWWYWLLVQVIDTWDLVSLKISLCHLLVRPLGCFFFLVFFSFDPSVPQVIQICGIRERGKAQGSVDGFPFWSSTSPGALEMSEVRRGRPSNSLVTGGHIRGSEADMTQPFKTDRRTHTHTQYHFSKLGYFANALCSDLWYYIPLCCCCCCWRRRRQQEVTIPWSKKNKTHTFPLKARGRIKSTV